MAPQLRNLNEELPEFLRLHKKKNIAFITTGGAQVPLDRNMVNYMETRCRGADGAAFAEYFLKKDYAVIFLHREDSPLPFSPRRGSLYETFELPNKIVIKRCVALKEAEKSDEDYSSLLFNVSYRSFKDYFETLGKMGLLLDAQNRRVLTLFAAASEDDHLPEKAKPLFKVLEDNELNPEVRVAPDAINYFIGLAPHAMFVAYQVYASKEQEKECVSTLLDSEEYIDCIVSCNVEKKDKKANLWLHGRYLNRRVNKEHEEIEESIVYQLTIIHDDYINYGTYIIK
ncbi:unnamed protein product [Caenorhabditis auriculariae]|uniref:DNA/pantothenate metabolism flavoprotein C-terminal domain-containing protein n=1 Tax=Caenorhabditis auriculariae TaxID=2777116 RepID=A0A8S1HKX8_9PELO|nr:unnamed protein product [Caenorhabditis auriculariae]